MPLSRKAGLMAVTFLALAFGGALSARADTIQVVGVNSGGLSTATVVCEFNAQTNTLSFTVTNTSAITSPGSTSTITGIAGVAAKVRRRRRAQAE